MHLELYDPARGLTNTSVPYEREKKIISLAGASRASIDGSEGGDGSLFILG